MENQSTPEVIKSQYQYYQSKLFPFAYNVIGDTMEAEDVVQEILNHHIIESPEGIDNIEAYLVRSVINRSINAKKKLKVRREKYNGQWLPSPVRTEEYIYGDADRGHILNYSLLVLLERLNPRERAVFILKESFSFSHEEIAELLSTSVDNSRQLYRRARKKLEPSVTAFVPDDVHQSDAKVLSDAIARGDLDYLKRLLSDHIFSVSDGGPVRTALNTIRGADDVARFFLALYTKYMFPDTTVSFGTVNNEPAILFSSGDSVYRCIVLEYRKGVVAAAYIIVNPHKLHGLSR